MDEPLCPTCQMPMTSIAYGYPGAEMWEAEKRGDVVLGGCVVSGDDPTHRCTTCRSDGWSDSPF